MPAGPAGMGFVYFAATKLAGYTSFCHWVINRKLSPKHTTSPSLLSVPAKVEISLPNSWVAGSVRTLLGVAIGMAVGIAFWKIPFFAAQGEKLGDAGFFYFLVCLIPIRIGEWWVLLHTLYHGHPGVPEEQTMLIVGGILASFLLDGIGIVSAIALPGGMWVC